MLSRTKRVLNALAREHRQNPRLRDVIEALNDHFVELRQDLDLHAYRLAQMQADIDLLKMKPKGTKTKRRSPLRRASKRKRQ